MVTEQENGLSIPRGVLEVLFPQQRSRREAMYHQDRFAARFNDQ